jgi:hypothetical protein
LLDSTCDSIRVEGKAAGVPKNIRGGLRAIEAAGSYSSHHQHAVQSALPSANRSTGSEAHGAENLQQAIAKLREHSYSAVVVDQFLLESEPAESDQALEHLGTAIPVYVAVYPANSR